MPALLLFPFWVRLMCAKSRYAGVVDERLRNLNTRRRKKQVVA
jgi:hypothetical protein